MAKSGQYDKIWLNRAYSTATGIKTNPRRLPDIIARRKVGQFDAIEVPSKSDQWTSLIERNVEAMQQLPGSIGGSMSLKPIVESQK
jgi:hypothetical protein